MIPYSAFCTPASSQVSLDVHEEAVLPTLLRDRAGLDHPHIDIIENKLPSILYKRTAAVRQLETEADFLCARLIDAILRQNQETVVLSGQLLIGPASF